MADIEEQKYRLIEDIQQELGSRLHRLPMVNGTAIGRGERKDEAEIGLVVFLDRPKESVAVSELDEMVDGVRAKGVAVHFVERDLGTVPIAPVLLAEPEAAVGAPSRTDDLNPMIGGISCGPDVNIIRAGWSGTLGLVVNRRSLGELGILSNKHVMFYNNETMTVTQPARVDSVFNYPAGHDLSSFTGNIPFNGRQTYVDAAVATVDSKRTATTRKLFGVTADVTGVKIATSVRVGDAVSKSGLTTGITTGTVKYTSVSGPNGSEPNQFAIEGNGNNPFAKAGDSGSVVMCGTEVMGLLWGSNSDDNTTYAIVTPIEAVMRVLDIDI